MRYSHSWSEISWRLTKSLDPQRTRSKELCCGWKWCCPGGQSSVRCARVKGTLTIPWNVSQPIQTWNSLTSSRNSYTLSRWRAPIDIQRSNFVSCYASLYEFRFTGSPFQLSHSTCIQEIKRNNRLKIWQRTKIRIRKICIERKTLSPKILLNALLLKLVVNDCVALVSRHRSPQRWYSSILFQVHPDTSSDLFSDPSYLSSRFKV